MRRLLLTILLLLPLLACEDKTKAECKYEVQDEQLQVYNDILIDLVENQFYGLYLGDEGEDLLEKWIKLDQPDSADWLSFEEERIALHNQLIGDTANFKTIYLANSADFSRRFDELIPDNFWALPKDSSEARSFLGSYDADSKSVVRGLKEAQQEYSASDFKACTFKINKLGAAQNIFELEQKQKRSAIGQVSFSRIHWSSKKDKGILYYEFYCGSKCGKGELVGIMKVNGRWKIVDKMQLWIA